MTPFFDSTGHQHNLNNLGDVVRLEHLKSSSQGNPWPVIEECLNIWRDHHPDQWKSYAIHLDTTRGTRRDEKFGRSRTGMYRYTLDFPAKVMLMIRCLYTEAELPMNKQFFHEFAHRFTTFRIAEKI